MENIELERNLKNRLQIIIEKYKNQKQYLNDLNIKSKVYNCEISSSFDTLYKLKYNDSFEIKFEEIITFLNGEVRIKNKFPNKFLKFKLNEVDCLEIENTIYEILKQNNH